MEGIKTPSFVTYEMYVKLAFVFLVLLPLWKEARVMHDLFIVLHLFVTFCKTGQP